MEPIKAETAASPPEPAHVAKLYGEPMPEMPKDLYIPPDALEVFLETENAKSIRASEALDREIEGLQAGGIAAGEADDPLGPGEVDLFEAGAHDAPQFRR